MKPFINIFRSRSNSTANRDTTTIRAQRRKQYEKNRFSLGATPIFETFTSMGKELDINEPITPITPVTDFSNHSRMSIRIPETEFPPSLEKELGSSYTFPNSTVTYIDTATITPPRSTRSYETLYSPLHPPKTPSPPPTRPQIVFQTPSKTPAKRSASAFFHARPSSMFIEDTGSSFSRPQQLSDYTTTGGKLPFYFNAYSLSPGTREVFVQHPIVDKLLEAHIKQLRDRAWRLFPYPCVGMFEYARFNLRTYPLHRELLELLRTGAKYLDVGCCFGQDIRYLRTQPGIDPMNLYGVELRQEFIEMGYEMFLDRESLPSKIAQADVFDDNAWIYRELTGKLSVIHLGYILHLFDYNTQVDMVKRMMRLIDRKPGSMIVGKSVGAEAAGLFVHPTVGEMFRHSMITFREIWEENSGCNVAVYLHMGRDRRVSADGKQIFQHPANERAVELEFCVLILD